MGTCDDCGLKLKESGICSNCFEELYINDYQTPEDPPVVGKEWNEKVKEQRNERQTRK